MTARALTIFIAAMLVTGCSGNVRQYLRAPTTEPSPAFTEAGDLATPAPPSTAWWRGLNDPTLDALIDIAFEGNRDLRAAQANLQEARAVARLQGWTLLPSASLTAEYRRQQQSTAAFRLPGVDGETGGALIADDPTDFYAIGLEAAWEPDVFGRLRGDVSASRAQARAAAAAAQGALVAVAAEVSAQYVALRGAQARVAAARRNADSQRDTLRLTEGLKEAGRGTRLDVARAREQLAATEASLALLEADVAAAFYGLAVIVGPSGRAAVQALVDPAPLPDLPQSVDVGTPEELLRRRPDIQEAEQRLIAAAFRAAQRGDWWPRITLVGGASLSALEFTNLDQDAAFGFTVGPQIDWPILDWRRNQLRLRAREAQAAAEYEAFDRAIAAGLADVETALAALAASRRAAAFAQEGALAAEEAADLSRLRYREGLDPFFEVLDAERRLAESQDRLAQAQAQAATAYVRLGQALGVGWDVEDPAALRGRRAYVTPSE